MINFIKIIFLIGIITISLDNVESAKLKGVTTIDQMRYDYLKLEDQAWKIVLNNTLSEKTKISSIYEIYNIIAKDKLKGQYVESDYLILKRFYEWSILEEDLINIHQLFEAFRRIIENQMNLNDSNNIGLDYDVPSNALNNDNKRVDLDFTETILNDNKWPVNKTYEQIYDILIKQGLYYRTITIGESRSNLCNAKTSTQQILYQLYNAISVTELKGYAMMQFSWMLLKTYDKGNFTTESQLLRTKFEERILKTQDYLRNILERAERNIQRCDPLRHVEGETYLQITRLLQGYIENEVDMNNDGTCRENCAHYQYSENHGCFKDMYCSKQPKCSGRLYNCRFVDSDMWVCPSPYSSTRRYEYIEYENGKVLGKKSNCYRGTTKVDSWWRWIFWHCSYCFCTCDEQGKQSDRYFSLRESVSNITDNKIVTGIKFVKSNRIIHLQIQEGKLLPRGIVDQTTLKWVPIQNFTIYERNVRDGRDYHTLTWAKRSIDLDDLEAKASHVVTGAKLRLIGSHLNLEMRVTEMDFATGKLMDPELTSYWISNDNTESSTNKRTKIELFRPDIPTSQTASSAIDSLTNQYLEFTHTDMDADAAQTTVPFLDAQEVASDPAVPLTGLGLYHKGQKLSGGFIAPKVMTLSFTPYLQPPQVIDKYLEK